MITPTLTGTSNWMIHHRLYSLMPQVNKIRINWVHREKENNLKQLSSLHNIFQFSTNLTSHLSTQPLYILYYLYLYKCEILHKQTQNDYELDRPDGTSLTSSIERSPDYIFRYEVTLCLNYCYNKLDAIQKLVSSWMIDPPDIKSVNSIPKRHR
jgi:hypothetical protein